MNGEPAEMTTGLKEETQNAILELEEAFSLRYTQAKTWSLQVMRNDSLQLLSVSVSVCAYARVFYYAAQVSLELITLLFYPFSISKELGLQACTPVI